MTVLTQAQIEAADWPSPTPEMLASPQFEAIWQCIKRWDINVPDVYSGYCGANGNHVRAILDALTASAEIKTTPTGEVYIDTTEDDEIADADFAGAAEVGESEIEKLKHDIERYIQIINEAINESDATIEWCAQVVKECEKGSGRDLSDVIAAIRALKDH